MKIGLQFPAREIAPTRSAIADWVDAAARSGAEYIMVNGHVLGVDPDKQDRDWDKTWAHPVSHRKRYSYGERWHEPFALMSFIAARCNLGLVTGVIVLPQRNTAVVAKQATEVDILCDGKLRLGVAVGWNAAEFASMGMNFSDRGRRFNEQIGILRQFWMNDLVEFEGEFHTIRAAGIAPLPIQRPIPVWIGGAGLSKGVEPVKHLLTRIGKLGDGWCLDSATAPTKVTASAIRVIREAAAGCDRDPEAIGVDARLCAHPLGREGLIERASGWRKLGTLGATHLTIDPMGCGTTDRSNAGTALRDLVDTVREHSTR